MLGQSEDYFYSAKSNVEPYSYSLMLLPCEDTKYYLSTYPTWYLERKTFTQIA